jgi:hypothetical protein
MGRHLSLFVVLLVLSTTLLTACDDIGMDDLSYAPDAYGENGRCYYAYDPAEVVALQRAGLCPRTWTPVIMPVVWHSTYYMYYDSPSYYDHYIPVQRRTYYRTTVVKRFEVEHKTEITRYSSKGKWKGSDGKRYSGKIVTTKVKTKTTSTTAKTKTTTTRSRTTTTTRSSSRVSSRR